MRFLLKAGGYGHRGGHRGGMAIAPQHSELPVDYDPQGSNRKRRIGDVDGGRGGRPGVNFQRSTRRKPDESPWPEASMATQPRLPQITQQAQVFRFFLNVSFPPGFILALADGNMGDTPHTCCAYPTVRATACVSSFSFGSTQRKLATATDLCVISGSDISLHQL